MNPFLAWIRPVGSGGRPEHPIVLPPADPPGTWGGAGEPFPTPPIYIQIPPGVVDGKPEHPIWFPIYPEHPIVLPPDLIGPGVPAHPIFLPPGIWGPTDPRPSVPIYIPPGSLGGGKPEHPIYLPPAIWGPTDPRPTPPIHLPGAPDNPLPPVSGNTPAPPMAYPIDLYAHVPGLGVVGPITVHYPGPVPGHPLPGPQSPAQSRRG